VGERVAYCFDFFSVGDDDVGAAWRSGPATVRVGGTLSNLSSSTIT
jgi:hypothetical protein